MNGSDLNEWHSSTSYSAFDVILQKVLQMKSAKSAREMATNLLSHMTGKLSWADGICKGDSEYETDEGELGIPAPCNRKIIAGPVYALVLLIKLPMRVNGLPARGSARLRKKAC